MKKILIIDDQPEVSRLLDIALRGNDRQMFFASNGKEGIRLAHKVDPDLILLDLMMPGGVDGFAVASHLKKDATTSAAYILVMTAKVHEENRQQALAAGADDYIVKPFDVFELQARVSRLLG